LNGGRVALTRALLGPLDAVVEAVQQPADVCRVIGDAKAAPDHLRDPLARPALAAEAMRFRAAFHQRGDLSELLGREARLRTWSGMAAQSVLYALLASPFEPLAELTAPGVTPRAAAMSCCFQPCCFSSQARRRRPSLHSRQSSWVLLVLIAPA
jgi:hypothetical protein